MFLLKRRPALGTHGVEPPTALLCRSGCLALGTALHPHPDPSSDLGLLLVSVPSEHEPEAPRPRGPHPSKCLLSAGTGKERSHRGRGTDGPARGLSWPRLVCERHPVWNSGLSGTRGRSEAQPVAPPAPSLTFVMLPIWLLPSDSTCSLTSASSESILEIRLLNRLRSSRFTSVSSPSMASMLLKDRSGERLRVRVTVLNPTPPAPRLCCHLPGPRLGRRLASVRPSFWDGSSLVGRGSAPWGGGDPRGPGFPKLQAQPRLRPQEPL